MKYICFSYIEPGKLEGMTEEQQHKMLDECLDYDDHLRANGHFAGGEALQPPETALTLYWKNGKVATTDGPYADGEVKHSHRRSNEEGRMNASTLGADPERQLAAFIRKFSPVDQRLIRAVRTALRKRFPTANELVYDNYNFFVIGYSPTQRPSDAIVSIAARANGVGLCFIHGAKLPDPNKVLLGAGNQTRFIRIDSPQVLERPEVQALVAAAIVQAHAPLPAAGRGHLIIRSVSAKQRPRRKPPQRSAAR
jgi:hypothetical protein